MCTKTDTSKNGHIDDFAGLETGQRASLPTRGRLGVYRIIPRPLYDLLSHVGPSQVDTHLLNESGVNEITTRTIAQKGIRDSKRRKTSPEMNYV